MGDTSTARTRKPAAKPTDAGGITIAASLASAPIDAATDQDGPELDGRVLHIRSIAQEGRRRAGMAFTPEPTEVYPEQLTSENLAQLLSDPQLVVEID